MNIECYYDEKEKCLDDKKIVLTLKECIKTYQNGEIIEVRDTLFDIINAIDYFDRQD